VPVHRVGLITMSCEERLSGTGIVR
jgi:hypothetical protein